MFYGLSWLIIFIKTNKDKAKSGLQLCQVLKSRYFTVNIRKIPHEELRHVGGELR
jgi:hypothetical protein